MKKYYKIVLIIGLVSGIVLRYSYAQEEPPNDPILLEAIETVKNFLGNPNITPLFVRDYETEEWELEGVGKFFEFEAPGYEKIVVRVDRSPMEVVWWRKDSSWLQSVDRSQQRFTVEQMVQIATQYAQAHWPHWNKYPQKMIKWSWDKWYEWNQDIYDVKPIADFLHVYFIPYFVNSSEIKIPFFPALCTVGVEPYKGTIISFYWRQGATMTLSQDQLNPTVPPSQAEAEGEMALFNYYDRLSVLMGFGSIKGVVTVDIVMDPTRNITITDDSWWPKRLAIIATKTGEVRLVYIFDEVLIKDSATGEVVQKRWAVMDAHTKEIVFDMALSSLSKLSPQAQRRLMFNIVMEIGSRLVLFVGFMLFAIVIITSLIRRKRRPSNKHWC
jgi:hypothetical protein